MACHASNSQNWFIQLKKWKVQIFILLVDSKSRKLIFDAFSEILDNDTSIGLHLFYLSGFVFTHSILGRNEI